MARHAFTFAVSLLLSTVPAAVVADTITPPPTPPPSATPAPGDFAVVDGKPTGVGRLHIFVYPEESQVFVNSKLIGTGNQTLDSLPNGFYHVRATYGSKSVEEPVYVLPDTVVTRSLTVGRTVFFALSPSYTQLWLYGAASTGPEVEAGVQLKRHFYGVNYFFGQFGNGATTEGGSLLWHFDMLNYRRTVIVSPGASLGYWHSTGTKSPTMASWIPDNSSGPTFDEMLFAGVSLRASVGYEFVYATVKYSLLAGTRFTSMLSMGLWGRL
jgi:hypothetical protein